MAEQRFSSRQKFSDEVTYEVSGGSGVEVERAEALNVSSGGACIKADRAPAPGRVVMLKLPLKGSGITVPTLTEVVWSEPADKGRVMLGLRFLG